jgi:hypothetical protein
LTFFACRARLPVVTVAPGRTLIALACLALACLAAACVKTEKRGVPTLILYRVKPFAELPPMPESAQTASVGSMSFRAAPLLTDEESQELFEANLLLAGVFPVRVEMVHNGGDAIDLEDVRFRLRDADGAEWKALSARKAIARILKANNVHSYNPTARKNFAKEFGAYELDLKSPLTHAERRRQGFVFFQSPKKEAVTSPRGLVLQVAGLPQPVEMRLN